MRTCAEAESVAPPSVTELEGAPDLVNHESGDWPGGVEASIDNEDQSDEPLSEMSFSSADESSYGLGNSTSEETKDQNGAHPDLQSDASSDSGAIAEKPSTLLCTMFNSALQPVRCEHANSYPSPFLSPLLSWP